MLTHFNSIENHLLPILMIWDDETTWLVRFDPRRRKYHWAQENTMRSFVICTPVHSVKIITSRRPQLLKHVTNMGKKRDEYVFLWRIVKE